MEEAEGVDGRKVSKLAPHANLGKARKLDKNNPNAVISPEETGIVDMLAQIVVNDIFRLEQEGGLRPTQILDYYEGRLNQHQTKGSDDEKSSDIPTCQHRRAS